MKRIAKLMVALFLVGGASAASAQNFTFSNPTPGSTVQGTAATGVAVSVSYTAPGVAPPAAAAVDILIPPEFTSVVSSNTDNCNVGFPSAGRIRISLFNIPSIASGPACNLTFTVGAGVAIGNYNFSVCGAADGGGCVAGNATATFGTAFAVTAAPVVTGPSIVAGTPAFGSTTAVAGGFLGGAAVTQTITFGASTGGAAGGTTNLVCTEADANTTLSASATQNNIADGATPASITASFTPAAARTVVVNCTATRQGAADQTFSYTFNVAAGAALPPPPPPPEVVPASSLWSQLSLIALFAALGGLMLVLRRNG